MFLAPAVIFAGVLEVGQALQYTEGQSSRKETPLPPSDDSDRVTRRFATSEDVTLHRRFADVEGGVMTNAEVDSNGAIIELADSADSKQVVVFSEKPNNQQGLSVVGSRTEVPVTRRGIELACQALVDTFPFPTFGVAELLCVNSADYLVQRGIELTQSSVTYVADWMAKKVKGVSKKGKEEIKREIKAIMQRVPNRTGPSPQKKTSGMMSLGVSAPVAATRVVGRRGAPKTSALPNGVRVTHSELLTTIVSSSSANTFKAQGFVINPGKGDVFPWLSTMAVNYDKYRIVKMQVELITFSPTSTAGRVGVGYDPDSTDPLPYDRSEFFAMEKHMQGPVWQTIGLDLPTPKGELFVNSHTSSDSKLIDAGQFVVMTDQLTGTSTSVCDVVVHYTVELLKPQQALFSTQYTDMAAVAWGANVYIDPAIHRGNTLTKFYSSDSSHVRFVPPAGTYLVTVVAYDSGTGSPTVAFDNFSGNNIYKVLPTASTSVAVGSCIFKITNSPSVTSDGVVGAYVALGIGTVATTALEGLHITLTRISPSVYQYLDSVNHGGYTQVATS